jgi:hypothetical protein
VQEPAGVHASTTNNFLTTLKKLRCTGTGEQALIMGCPNTLPLHTARCYLHAVTESNQQLHAADTPKAAHVPDLPSGLACLPARLAAKQAAAANGNNCCCLTARPLQLCCLTFV